MKDSFNQLDHFFDCAFTSRSRRMAVGGHVSQVHEIDLKIVEKLAMASQVSGAAQRERSRSPTADQRACRVFGWFPIESAH